MTDRLTLTYINVGYGEAALICCPDPEREDGVFTALIDGGGDTPSEFEDRSSGRQRLSEYLSGHPLPHLDLMVVSHVHEDHVSGLKDIGVVPKELWHTYPAGFWNEVSGIPVDHTNPSLEKFTTALNDWLFICRQAEKAGTALRQIDSSSGTIRLTKELSVEVLGPSAERAGRLTEALREALSETDEDERRKRLARLDSGMNNLSLILRFHYGSASLLLPGDTNAGGYAQIAGELKSQVFKMGHHGQKDALTEEILERVQATDLICCASSDRRYQSAAPEAMDMVRRTGARLWFSDCPEGQDAPPHGTMTLTVSKDGSVDGRYD